MKIRFALNEYDVAVLLGQQVVAMREQRGWSQVDLAKRAKVAVTTLSRIEGGKYDGSLEPYKRIASAFDVALEVKLGSWLEWLAMERDVPLSWEEESLARINGEGS